MDKNKQAYFKGAIIVAIFIIVCIYSATEVKKDGKTVADYNLQLSGSIIGKKEFMAGHDYGQIAINIHNSNYGDFDERGKKKKYFFIIKGNRCVLSIGNISEIHPGDSIVVNRNMYTIYRDGKALYNNYITLLDPIYHDSPESLLNL